MSEVLFGLNVGTATDGDPVADARRAEGLGFDFVSANDHLHGDSARFETWTMLSWIAAGTTRIRVASRVLGLPYRAPAVVAKMAESFDRLSGGRLILGLGGGASDDEFRAFGLPVPTPREKVDGLEEATRIVRGMWSEPAFSHDGRLYSTHDARIEPKPERAIPIWLGTLGPRALDVTGRVADGWIPSYDLAPPDVAAGMRERIRAAASAAGRDPDEVTCVYNIDIRVDERAGDEVGIVSGSPERVIEQLLAFRAIGFTSMNFCPVGPALDEQAERLAREVIPEVRGAP